MKSRFYIEESRRNNDRNYIYYIIIGTIWLLDIVSMCMNYNGNPQYSGELYGYSVLHFFGAFQLMSSVSENLYYVKELGKRNLRLKKYQCTPLIKKQCILAYETIMAKYLLILTVGFLLLHFAAALFTQTRLPLLDTVQGVLYFLLANAIGYVWITVLNILKNIK